MQLVARTALGIGLLSYPAAALPSGVATPNCGGCHAESGFDGELSLTPGGELTPGQETEFVLTVRESHMLGTGFFVTTGGVGTFNAAEGARISGGDLLHSRPNTASDGVTEIHFGWTAPAEPGGAEFAVYVVAANIDGTSTGDRAARSVSSLTWGCEPVRLYADLDRDGFGDERDTIVRCSAIEGWADVATDCNDLVAFIHPGALEQSNGRDDDCNGETDEGIEIATLYPDNDGDGFGAPTLAPFEGQVGLAGYSPSSEDCDDENPDVHPDIAEVCDGIDNNCSGRADEGTFEYCGIGRCAQRLELCDRECVPSAPSAEACNGLDDDCDGFIDNGELCPPGEACIDFHCSATDALEAGAPDADASSPATTTEAEGTATTPGVAPQQDASPGNEGSGASSSTQTPDAAPVAGAVVGALAGAQPSEAETDSAGTPSTMDASGSPTDSDAKPSDVNDEAASHAESSSCALGRSSPGAHAPRGTRNIPGALTAVLPMLVLCALRRRRPGQQRQAQNQKAAAARGRTGA